MKVCTKCGIKKNVCEYSKKGKNRDGSIKYESQCKDCKKKSYKDYYKENATELSKKRREYYNENIDKLREHNKEYYKKNKNKQKEHMKKYFQTQEGKEANRRRVNKRRALKADNGGSYTAEQWNECLNFFDNKCAYTGLELDSLEVEHIVPVSKGGTSYITNLVPSNREPNRSKSNKEMIRWYKKQEYFSQERLDKILKWIEYSTNKYSYNMKKVS